MWIKRKTFDELLARLAKLEREANQQPAAGFDAGGFLAALMDGQVKQVGSMTDFMRMIAEVASERASSALGRKAGKRRAATAERDARGRMLPTRRAMPVTDCPLCDDPTTAAFTAQQWEMHQLHKNRPRAVAPPPTQFRQDDDDGSSEHQHHHHHEHAAAPAPQPAYPLPVVTRPDASGGAGGGGAAESNGHTNGVVESDVS